MSPTDMEIYFRGQLEGEFEGFNGDRVFEFTNGDRWEQIRQRYRYTYRYRPIATILKDGGRFFLEVEGLDEKVEVKKV